MADRANCNAQATTGNRLMSLTGIVPADSARRLVTVLRQCEIAPILGL
ncbi:hypothetical protein [Xanthomonas sacchari]|nr:hypothetical protein [Xanthomonas sacchari]MDV0438640.1 hypothetical protein [Xanthomonas sacchari]